MTKKKIICRISNGFGNQMFMYATSYSFSKQLNYKLFLDTFSGINQDIKKSLKKGFKHYKPQYELSIFNLTANLLPKDLTFDSFFGHFKRKFLIFLDKFILKKTAHSSEQFIDLKKKSALVVSSDSGPLHIALALKKDLLAIMRITIPDIVINSGSCLVISEY